MPVAATKDNLKLNEFLVGRRRFLKVRFGDLVQKTGIPAKHLKKIEKGDWCDLPAGVYVKGFLKRYARAVGLDEAELALRYEAEWREVCYAPQPPAAAAARGFTRLGFIGQYSLRRWLAALAGALVLAYFFWQFKVVFERPELNLTNPPQENTVSAESTLAISGRVSAGALLTINSETVYQEQDGLFTKEIELQPGLNVLEVKAVSRFGKETKITRRVTYNP